ncbi:MAG: hypothetical protein AAB388_01505 [Patescibacteria group bacterium]
MKIDGTYTIVVDRDGIEASFTLQELFEYLRFKKQQAGEPTYFLTTCHVYYVELLDKFPRTARHTYEHILAWQALTPLPRSRSLVVMEKDLPKTRR